MRTGRQHRARAIFGAGRSHSTTLGVKMTIRTHYANLQVAENASPEVIRGAYRYLSQRWHPDKNPDNWAEAERITKIINEAYAVLSDPVRRQEHDLWIKTERERVAQVTAKKEEPIVPPPYQSQGARPVSSTIKPSIRRGATWGVVAGVASFIFFALTVKPTSQVDFNITTFIFFVVAGAIVGAWGLRR